MNVAADTDAWLKHLFLVAVLRAGLLFSPLRRFTAGQPSKHVLLEVALVALGPFTADRIHRDGVHILDAEPLARLVELVGAFVAPETSSATIEEADAPLVPA